MLRYFKKKDGESSQSNALGDSPSVNSPSTRESQNQLQVIISDNQAPTENDLSSLKADPLDRKPILEYAPEKRDEVRRYYILKGPFQPRNHDFPQTDFYGVMRRFNSVWFDAYGDWLEYSIKADAAFCLCCYLFKNEHEGHGGAIDSFTSKGFRSWNTMDRFKKHIGEVNSVHDRCLKKMLDLRRQSQSIHTAFDKQSEKTKSEYRTRLTTSIDVARLLLSCGLPFRGNDEHESSRNKGNFLTILKWYAERKEEVGSIVLKNAPGNQKLTSPKIQKDIVNACAKETVKAIVADIGDDYFGILADESRDASHKEQMALVLRYVDKRGIVMERFVGIVHVSDTSARALKEEIYSLLAQHSLSASQIRGQGYDGASNMQGDVNGLKTLIMRDTQSAYCIHCFAHQLQLTLVAVASKVDDVAWLFDIIANVLNCIGASFKRRDKLREKQAEKQEELYRLGELETGRGLNQELGLRRPGDTRWGSHFKTVLNVIDLFPSIIDVLDAVATEGLDPIDRIKAQRLLDDMQTFEFVYLLHLMKKILAITNELNLALQRQDQDIVNAMSLVALAKKQLQVMREEGWDALVSTTSAFCTKNDIVTPNMNDLHVIRGKSKRRVSTATNSHYFRIELFYAVVDRQLQELNSRFNEVNTELLLGVASLNPANGFASYDKEKIMKLAKFYPYEFDRQRLQELDCQLDNFIFDMRHNDDRFSNLRGISDLSKKLVETKKHITWSHVYLLVKLALILPVATATVERAFSAMKYIKNDLRNRMSDQFLNDCLLTYIENDVFESISIDAIIDHFQNMKTRRGQL